MTRTTTRKARAPLGVRIALAVLAVCLLAVGGWAGWNLAAGHRYNEASQTLSSLIRQAASKDADASKLAAQAKEAQASLESLESQDTLMLPQLGRDVRTNAAVARELTSRLEQAAGKQSDAKASSGSPQESSAAETQQPKLTEGQRQQVEEVLKQNEQRQGSETSTQESSPTPSPSSTTQATAKPG
ncbi:MAG: DUF6466 family protein [Bifidobacterium sp.]|nr:DUF6466 family protein [Bifidobacterium sp.]